MPSKVTNLNPVGGLSRSGSGPWVSQVPVYTKQEILTHTPVVGDGGPFAVTKDDVVPILLKGHVSRAAGIEYLGYVYGESNYPRAGRLSSVWACDFNLGDKGNAAYAADLLARTSPNRSEVEIPVFAKELKDIPHLVKILGDNIPKTLAQANLNYWFGWRPLLSDLNKIMNFQSNVYQRFLEIKQLAKSGLRRTVHLDNTSADGTPVNWTRFTPDTFSTDRIDVRAISTRKTSVWGHVKWIPTGNIPKTDAAMMSMARRAVYGLTIDFSTAWQAMPWSWLVDWFTSVGDFLAYQRNIVPCDYKDLLIMRQHELSCTMSPKMINSSIIATEGRVKCTYKTRSTAQPSITAFLPGITPRQLSILASLYVMRT